MARLRLAPAFPPISQTLTRIIENLGDPDFTTREKATKELDQYGEIAVGPVTERMSKLPSPEARVRCEAFVKKFTGGGAGSGANWPMRVRSKCSKPLDSDDSRVLEGTGRWSRGRFPHARSKTRYWSVTRSNEPTEWANECGEGRVESVREVKPEGGAMERARPYLKVAAVVSAVALVGALVAYRAGAFSESVPADPQPELQPATAPQTAPEQPITGTPQTPPAFMFGSKSAPTFTSGLPATTGDTAGVTPVPSTGQSPPVFLGGSKSLSPDYRASAVAGFSGDCAFSAGPAFTPTGRGATRPKRAPEVTVCRPLALR